MSSHPPMRTLKATSADAVDPPRNLVTAHLIGGYIGRCIEDARISRSGKHVKHIVSVPHRGHLSHHRPQTQARSTQRLYMQNQGMSVVCASCVDRVEIDDLVRGGSPSAPPAPPGQSPRPGPARPQ